MYANVIESLITAVAPTLLAIVPHKALINNQFTNQSSKDAIIACVIS